jgi:hypothetical protein
LKLIRQSKTTKFTFGVTETPTLPNVIKLLELNNNKKKRASLCVLHIFTFSSYTFCEITCIATHHEREEWNCTNPARNNDLQCNKQHQPTEQQ